MRKFSLLVTAWLLSVGIFVTSGCLTEHYNLRTIHDTDREYMSADSAAYNMRWNDPEWRETYLKYWTSAGVIVTNEYNLFENNTWLEHVVDGGFEGMIVLEWNPEKIYDWSAEADGSFRKQIDAINASYEPSVYVYDLDGFNLSQFTDDSYVLNPSIITTNDNYGDEIGAVVEAQLAALDTALDTNNTLTFALMLPNYPYRAYGSIDDVATVQSNFDPFDLSKAISSYTNEDYETYVHPYYDALVKAFSRNEVTTLVSGHERLLAEDPTSSILSRRESIGVMYKLITPETIDDYVTTTTTLRTAFAPEDSTHTIMFIAGVKNDVYQETPTEYSLMMNKIIDAGMYFTPGANDAYFNVPLYGMADWWFRYDNDSNWQADPNNPEYTSVTTSPRYVKIEPNIIISYQPVADFAALEVSGMDPFIANFSDLSTNTPTSWVWVFGDGDSAFTQNPSHEYSLEGTYTVSLTATNAYGSDTETKVDYITVISSDEFPLASTPLAHPVGGWLWSSAVGHDESYVVVCGDVTPAYSSSDGGQTWQPHLYGLANESPWPGHYGRGLQAVKNSYFEGFILATDVGIHTLATPFEETTPWQHMIPEDDLNFFYYKYETWATAGMRTRIPFGDVAWDGSNLLTAVTGSQRWDSLAFFEAGYPWNLADGDSLNFNAAEDEQFGAWSAGGGSGDWDDNAFGIVGLWKYDYENPSVGWHPVEGPDSYKKEWGMYKNVNVAVVGTDTVYVVATGAGPKMLTVNGASKVWTDLSGADGVYSWMDHTNTVTFDIPNFTNDEATSTQYYLGRRHEIGEGFVHVIEDINPRIPASGSITISGTAYPYDYYDGKTFTLSDTLTATYTKGTKVYEATDSQATWSVLITDRGTIYCMVGNEDHNWSGNSGPYVLNHGATTWHYVADETEVIVTADVAASAGNPVLTIPELAYGDWTSTPLYPTYSTTSNAASLFSESFIRLSGNTGVGTDPDTLYIGGHNSLSTFRGLVPFEPVSYANITTWGRIISREWPSGVSTNNPAFLVNRSTPTGWSGSLIHEIAVDPENSNNIFAFPGVGMGRSVDGGQNWINNGYTDDGGFGEIGTGLDEVCPAAIAVLSDGRLIQSNGDIFPKITTDSTWTYFDRFTPLDAQVYYSYQDPTYDGDDYMWGSECGAVIAIQGWDNQNFDEDYIILVNGDVVQQSSASKIFLIHDNNDDGDFKDAGEWHAVTSGLTDANKYLNYGDIITDGNTKIWSVYKKYNTIPVSSSTVEKYGVMEYAWNGVDWDYTDIGQTTFASQSIRGAKLAWDSDNNRLWVAARFGGSGGGLYYTDLDDETPAWVCLIGGNTPSGTWDNESFEDMNSVALSKDNTTMYVGSRGASGKMGAIYKLSNVNDANVANITIEAIVNSSTLDPLVLLPNITEVTDNFRARGWTTSTVIAQRLATITDIEIDYNNNDRILVVNSSAGWSPALYQGIYLVDTAPDTTTVTQLFENDQRSWQASTRIGKDLLLSPLFNPPRLVWGTSCIGLSYIEYQTYNPFLIANFSVDVTGGVLPLTVGFTDLSIGDPTSWLWSFGDGDTAQSPNPTHEYTDAGIYTVSLTVENAYGYDTKTRTGLINITVPPVAEFESDTQTGNYPLTVAFSDLSTNWPTEWLWSFGDDSTSTVQNPTHEYEDVGVYTVSLIATNAAGADTMTKVDYINVLSDPPVIASMLDGGASPQIDDGSNEYIIISGTFFGSTTGSVFFADTPELTDAQELTSFLLWNSTTIFFQESAITFAFDHSDTIYIKVVKDDALESEVFGGAQWYVPTTPAITSVTPFSIIDGQEFIINGTGFLDSTVTSVVSAGIWNGSILTFGAAQIITSWSESQIVCELVENGSWIEDTSTLTFRVTNEDGLFDYYGVDYDAEDLLITFGTLAYPPVADFSGTPTSGVQPLEVTFTDLSLNDPTSWFWTFGDDSTSTDQNPIHTYALPDTYTVVLIATNATGSDTLTRVDYIGVTPDVTPPSVPVLAAMSTPQHYKAVLSWDDNTATDFSHYKIYRNGALAPTIPTATTLFVDNYADSSGFVFNYTPSYSYDVTDSIYAYRVTAVDIYGNESGFSANRRRQIEDLVAPNSPTDLYLEGLGGSPALVRLSWPAVFDSTTINYEVFRSSYANMDSMELFDETGTATFGVYESPIGETYYYTVRCHDVANNYSGFSEMVGGDSYLYPSVDNFTIVGIEDNGGFVDVDVTAGMNKDVGQRLVVWRDNQSAPSDTSTYDLTSWITTPDDTLSGLIGTGLPWPVADGDLSILVTWDAGDPVPTTGYELHSRRDTGSGWGDWFEIADEAVIDPSDTSYVHTIDNATLAAIAGVFEYRLYALSDALRSPVAVMDSLLFNDAIRVYARLNIYDGTSYSSSSVQSILETVTYVDVTPPDTTGTFVSVVWDTVTNTAANVSFTVTVNGLENVQAEIEWKLLVGDTYNALGTWIPGSPTTADITSALQGTSANTATVTGVYIRYSLRDAALNESPLSEHFRPFTRMADGGSYIEFVGYFSNSVATSDGGFPDIETLGTPGSEANGDTLHYTTGQDWFMLEYTDPTVAEIPAANTIWVLDVVQTLPLSSISTPTDNVGAIWYFNVASQLKVGDEIVDADLFIWATQTESDTSDSLCVAGWSTTALREWVGNASQGDASANYSEASTTTAWSFNFDDLTTWSSFGPLTRQVMVWTGNTWQTVDITSQLQSWVDDANPEGGLMVHLYGNGGSAQFAGPNRSLETLRPYIRATIRRPE